MARLTAAATVAAPQAQKQVLAEEPTPETKAQ